MSKIEEEQSLEINKNLQTLEINKVEEEGGKDFFDFLQSLYDIQASIEIESLHGRRVYLHGLPEDMAVRLEYLKERCPDILFVIGCYNNDVHKEVFKNYNDDVVATPMYKYGDPATYLYRLEVLRKCKWIHEVIADAPLHVDQDFMSKHNLVKCVTHHHDPDLNTFPLVAINKNLKRKGPDPPHPRFLAPNVYDEDDVRKYKLHIIKKSYSFRNQNPNPYIVVGILSDEDALKYLPTKAAAASRTYKERLESISKLADVDYVILSPWWKIVIGQDFLPEFWDKHDIDYYLVKCNESDFHFSDDEYDDDDEYDGDDGDGGDGGDGHTCPCSDEKGSDEK